MGNLVALRCSVIELAPDRELLWFLQWLSHQPGGLPAFSQRLLEKSPDRNTTESMQVIGLASGQIYDAEQVKVIRAEIPKGAETFPLRGEGMRHFFSADAFEDGIEIKIEAERVRVA